MHKQLKTSSKPFIGGQVRRVEVPLVDDLSLRPLSQIDEAEHGVVLLQLNYASFDDLGLLGQRQVALLLVLLQVLSEFVDGLLFCDWIGTVIISGQI